MSKREKLYCGYFLILPESSLRGRNDRSNPLLGFNLRGCFTAFARTVGFFREALMNKVTLSLTLLLVASLLSAQDFKQALLKMQKEYGDAERIHIVMSIKAFDKKTSTDPFYVQKAEIKKDSQNYFYRFGVNDMLMNRSYLIMVDHSAKQITFSKSNLASGTPFKDPFKMNLDSLLIAYGKSSYLGKNDSLDHYQIVHSKGTVKQTDMYFSTQTSLLRKVEYSYAGDQRVSIDFDLFDKQAEFAPDTFNEERYMVRLNDKLIPSQAYLHYKIVDAAGGNKTVSKK